MSRVTPTFLHHEPEWEAAVGRDWWRHIFSARITDRHHAKQGRSIARWTVRCGERARSFFVKRHYRHSWWRTLLHRWFRWGTSDAQLEWHHLQRAKRCGIPIPRAVAVVELPHEGTLRSALVIEELEQRLALHEAIPAACRSLDAESLRIWKNGLIDEMARLVRRLHDRGLFHRDLYFCHFFIERRWITEIPETWRGRVVLIDFHRLTRRRWFVWLTKIKDLAQWHYSSAIEGVTDQDRERFWRAYERGRPRHWLRFLVRWKARLYQRKQRGPGA